MHGTRERTGTHAVTCPSSTVYRHDLFPSPSRDNTYFQTFQILKQQIKKKKFEWRCVALRCSPFFFVVSIIIIVIICRGSGGRQEGRQAGRQGRVGVSTPPVRVRTRSGQVRGKARKARKKIGVALMHTRCRVSESDRGRSGSVYLL